METFLWGLLATALLGVAIPAWQKPEFFLDYMSPWLNKLVTAAAVLAGVWQFSATFTRSAIVKVIPNLTSDILVNVQAAGDMPFSVWIGIIGFGIYHGVMSMVAYGLIQHAKGRSI